MLPGIVTVQPIKQAQVQLTQMDIIGVRLSKTPFLQQGAHFLKVCCISKGTGKDVHMDKCSSQHRWMSGTERITWQYRQAES
jgi:hypothetical protein